MLGGARSPGSIAGILGAVTTCYVVVDSWMIGKKHMLHDLHVIGSSLSMRSLGFLLKSLLKSLLKTLFSKSTLNGWFSRLHGWVGLGRSWLQRACFGILYDIASATAVPLAVTIYPYQLSVAGGKRRAKSGSYCCLARRHYK
jgi:hypothetical protein